MYYFRCHYFRRSSLIGFGGGCFYIYCFQSFGIEHVFPLPQSQSCYSQLSLGYVCYVYESITGQQAPKAMMELQGH